MTAAPASVDSSLLLVLSALTYGCLRQGGFRRDGFIGLAVLTVIAAAVAVLRYVPRPDFRRRIGGVAPALLILGASTVASGAFNHAAPVAVAARVTLVAVVLSGFVVASAVAPAARWAAAEAVVVIGGLVGASGWAGVALRRAPLGFVADGLWRASSWLTYPNALGVLCVVCFFPAVCLLAARRVWWRWLLAWLLLVAAASSQSRGAALGLLAGLLALVCHRPGRAVLATVLLVGIAAAPAGLAVLARSPVDNPAPVAFLPLGMGVGACLLLASARRPRVTFALGVVAVVVAPLLMAGRLDAVISSRLSARSPVAGGEQYEPFLGDRGRIWQAALQQWREHPLLGTGPGRIELAWISDDGRRYVARFVHNDYLELAASQGVVGLVALGGASYLVARPTRDARRRRDPVQVGTQAALVAFAVASAFDFLWRLAILPLVVAVFFGLAGVADDDDG